MIEQVEHTSSADPKMEVTIAITCSKIIFFGIELFGNMYIYIYNYICVFIHM